MNIGGKYRQSPATQIISLNLNLSCLICKMTSTEILVSQDCHRTYVRREPKSDGDLAGFNNFQAFSFLIILASIHGICSVPLSVLKHFP